MSLAFRYLRNQADAEDVLQETFIKAFHSLPRYNPDKGLNFSCWLNKICINASIDALRRNKAKGTPVTAVEEAADMPDLSNSSDPERTARNREIRERIDGALDKLSPKQRLIFTLRHYQEYSIREIAEHMETTEGSTKKHLFRAVETLKKRLKRFVMEDGYEM